MRLFLGICFLKQICDDQVGKYLMEMTWNFSVIAVVRKADDGEWACRLNLGWDVATGLVFSLEEWDQRKKRQFCAATPPICYTHLHLQIKIALPAVCIFPSSPRCCLPPRPLRWEWTCPPGPWCSTASGNMMEPASEICGQVWYSPSQPPSLMLASPWG